MSVIRLFTVSFALFTVTDSVMLFTNDGDTIKGMRKVKQVGHIFRLSFMILFLHARMKLSDNISDTFFSHSQYLGCSCIVLIMYFPSSHSMNHSIFERILSMKILLLRQSSY